MNNRPASESTNPKTAPVPSPKNQPGVMTHATPDKADRPIASRPSSRIGERVKKQKEL
jgi:hypothetical protein